MTNYHYERGHYDYICCDSRSDMYSKLNSLGRSGWTSYGRSIRPSDNGVQYGYYIRVPKSSGWYSRPRISSPYPNSHRSTSYPAIRGISPRRSAPIPPPPSARAPKQAQPKRVYTFRSNGDREQERETLRRMRAQQAR